MRQVPALKDQWPLPDLDEHRDSIEVLIAREGGDLVPLLQAIQLEFGWLPQNVLAYVGQVIGVPMARIWGVATFYSSFHLRPRGRSIIRVCHGTACHVRGAPRITEAITSHLGMSATGETTADMSYSIDRVGCIGCCSLAPVLSLDDDIHGKLNRSQALDLLREHEESDSSRRAIGSSPNIPVLAERDDSEEDSE